MINIGHLKNEALFCYSSLLLFLWGSASETSGLVYLLVHWLTGLLWLKIEGNWDKSGNIDAGTLKSSLLHLLTIIEASSSLPPFPSYSNAHLDLNEICYTMISTWKVKIQNQSCLFSFCRLSSIVFGTLCNVYCAKCNVGTISLFDYPYWQNLN